MVPRTEEKVKKIIADQFGLKASEVDLSADLVKDLGANSLDLVELAIAFEEFFEKDAS